MSELGKLYYSLGLKTEDFEAKLNQIKDVVKGIGRDNNSISLNTDKVEEATRKVVDLKSKIDALRDGQNRVTLTCATPKNIVIDDVRISNTSALRDAVITALNGIEIQNVSISTANLKSQLKNEVWNIEVVADANNISKVAQRIRQFLTGNKNIKIAVSPDMSDKNIQQLRKRIETELGKSVLKGIKLDIERKRIQDQLNAMNLTATIDIKVNKTSAQQAVQDAVGNTNHINQGNNALNQRSEIQQRVNKKATDELGIRRSINDQMSRNTQLATILGNAMGNVFGAYMLKNFLENLVQIGGEIQKQRLALGHIIDNVANANALFEQMKQLAVKSPFGLLDLMQNARQLSAFGVEYNQLYDTMKRLSDMAAGLGIQFSRLALAYGETKERGFLDGKLVRQFSYMGLPVLQKVAEYYTQIDKLQNGSVVTAAQVRSMVSDKAVSFEDVDAVIKKMTEEGGQFYNMQEVMAESVAGKWKNLKDAIDIMYSDIVESNSRILKAPAAILTSLTKNYDALAVILAVVAARLIGHKGAMAINNALLNKNAQAVLLNKKAIEAQQLAEQKALATAIRKNGTLARLTAQEKQRLANLKQMSMAEMKQVIRQQELTKGDLQRLIMMDRLSKEQIAYLVRLKAISQAEVDAAMKMTRFGMVASSVWKSITSFLSGNWLFLLGTVIAELGMIWYRNSEKQKEFNEGIRQSADDFRKATAQMADEVNGLDFGSMSFGERETEIKSMVEYIKDNVPDAERKLADIFKTGTDGKFVKSSEEIFKALKNIVKGMEELSLTDLAEWENSTRDILDKLDLPDHVESYMKSRSELVSKFNKILGDMKASDRNAILDKFKSQYKNVLMEAFNLSNEDDLKKKSQEQLLGIISSNKDLLHKFLNSNQETFKSIISGTKNYWGIYLNEYDKTLESVATSMATLKNKIENKEGKLNWKLSSNQEKWKRAIDVTVTTEYKDKTSEEQKMIKQLMTNPEILTMLGVHKGTVDEFAKKVLNDSDIRKNVYLNIMTMYDGKVTQDPFEDWRKGLTGEVKTDKTAAGDYETIVKQTKSAVEALNNAKKASNLMRDVQKNGLKWESKVSGSNAVTADWKEKIETFAQQLTTLESNLETAHQSALSYGFDWNKILADAQKKTDKGSGSSSKKDTYLESVKEQFDEVKKAYSEFNKWAAKIGKDNAAKELGKQGGLLAGLNLDDFASPSAYLKKIQKMIADFRTKVGNDNARKKQLTSMLQLEADIKLNIREEEIKNAMSKAEQEINKLAKQFDIFKALLGVGKSEDEASQIALSVVPVMDKKASWYQKELVKQAAELGLTLPTDMSLYMDDKQADDFFKKLGADGMGSVLLPIYKQLRDAMVQAGYDSANAIVDVLKNSDSYILKSKAIENTLTTKIDAINASKATNKEELIAEARKQANEQLNKLAIDSYKKTLGFDVLFSNIDGISKTALSSIRRQLEAIIQDAKDIDPTNMKTLVDMLEKVKTAESKRGNFIANIANALGELNTAKTSRNILLNNEDYQKLYRQYDKIANVKDKLSFAESTKIFDPIKNETITLAEYMRRLADAENDVARKNNTLNKSMTALSNNFKSITNLGKNVVKMVAGDNNVSTYIGNMVNSLQSLVDASSKLDFSQGFFSSNNIDQINAIATSIGDMVQASKQLSSMRGQQETEQLKKWADNMVSIYDSLIERIQKKIQSSGVADVLSSGYDELVDKYTNKMNIATSKIVEILEKTVSALGKDYVISGNLYNPIASKTSGHTLDWNMLQGNYGYKSWAQVLEQYNKKFGTDFQSLRDLFSHNWTREELDWLTENYQEWIAQSSDITSAIKDISDALDNLEETSRTSLFLGSSWDEFYSSFISQCQNMENASADLANSIYENLNNAIIDAMIDAQFQQRIKDLYNRIGEYSANDELGTNGGLFSQSEIEKIKQETEALANDIYNARQSFLDAGELVDTSEISSSASSSIQNISEETASILAALMQGMRLDLSIQRLAVESIRDAIGVDGTRSLNAIAEAQLAELNSIVTHTYNTHQELVALNSRIDDVINGTKALHVE